MSEFEEGNIYSCFGFQKWVAILGNAILYNSPQWVYGIFSNYSYTNLTKTTTTIKRWSSLSSNDRGSLLEVRHPMTHP